jgi:hypothetical protein
MIDPLVASVIAWARPELAVTPRSVVETPNPSSAEWDDLTDVALRERITGMLWCAVDRGMPVSPVQRIEAATMAHDSMRSVVQLEATAQWILETLESADIDVRLIKGLATAHVIHPDASHRDSGDIDLLVLPADLARSASVLLDAGLEQEARWGDGAIGFAKELVFLSAPGVEIDLHQSLNFGERWRRLTPKLMANGLTVGGEDRLGPRFTTLNIEGLFVSAAVSACRSDGRISGLLDLAVLSHDPRLCPDRLREILDSAGLAPAILPVLDRASRLFVLGSDVVDAVVGARQSKFGSICARLEASETGARYLYSCLSGPPRIWAPGLHALALPDASHFEHEPSDQRGRVRRIAVQSSAILRSVRPSRSSAS